MSYSKWRPFYLRLNVLATSTKFMLLTDTPSSVWYSISWLSLCINATWFPCKIQQLMLFKIGLTSFLSNLRVVECFLTISTSRVIGTVCASYLESYWYATVNTAIIYLYHGLLPVRYVAYTIGLNVSDMYLFRNVNGLLGKTSINTFPGKWQDDGRHLIFQKQCTVIDWG